MKNISFSLVCFVLACTNPRADLSVGEMQAIEVEVRKVLNAYYSAIRSEGLLAEFDYLDSSENFFWVPPGVSMALPYDSIAKIIRRNAARFSSVDNSWDTLVIRPINHELAIYTGRLRSMVTDTAGVQTTTRLAETGVVTKQDDRWKLLSGQTSVVSE